MELHLTIVCATALNNQNPPLVFLSFSCSLSDRADAQMLIHVFSCLRMIAVRFAIDGEVESRNLHRHRAHAKGVVSAVSTYNRMLSL